MAVQLPNNVLQNIFVRVKDVATLFRCATACKRWCSLLASDAAFLRRCLPEDACRSSPFTGLFTQQRRPRGLPESCFVPAPRPVFDVDLLDCPRPLSSFVPAIPDSAVPLTSRDRLLLVRAGDVPIVCNPVTGRFKSLPPLKHNFGSANYSTGYAILTAADCNCSCPEDEEDKDGGGLPFFKVLVMVVQKDTMEYRIQTFSSAGERGWSVCSGRVDHNMCAPLCQQNAVVCGGAARWFFCNTSGVYSLAVGAKTGDVSMTKLLAVKVKPRDTLRPKTHDEPCLGLDAEGRLTLFSLQLDGNQVDIWTCNADGRCSPSLLKLDPPSKKEKKKKAGAGRRVEYTCLGEKSGTLLIKDDQQRVYATCIKTGAMQEVTDCPRGGVTRREIVPLDIDWPALFVSRLGEIVTWKIRLGL